MNYVGSFVQPLHPYATRLMGAGACGIALGLATTKLAIILGIALVALGIFARCFGAPRLQVSLPQPGASTSSTPPPVIPTVKLNVQSPHGDRFNVLLSLDATVQTLRDSIQTRAISQQPPYRHDGFRLRYKGVELQDNCAFRSLNIEDEAQIFCTWKVSPQPSNSTM